MVMGLLAPILVLTVVSTLIRGIPTPKMTIATIVDNNRFFSMGNRHIDKIQNFID